MMNKRQRKKKLKKETTVTIGGKTYTFTADLTDDDGNLNIGCDGLETFRAVRELEKDLLKYFNQT